MSDTENLRGVTLFRNLAENMLAEFAGYFKRTAYKAGDVIFKEKSAGSTLYIIVSGEVVIEKGLDEEGREFKTLAILSGGDFFGEMAVIEGQARFAQARASRDSQVYEVGRTEFFAFIKEHPETGITIFSEIMRTVFRRLQHTSSELTMLFDLSRLLLAPHRSPGEFLAAVMGEIRIYLEGSWNITAYVYNRFNEEYEQVYAKETFRKDAAPLPAAVASGWLDDKTYLAACAAEGRALGCAVFEREQALSPVEKNNLATIFNTISSILGSAMINIEHQTEAAMLEQLRKTKNTI
ncbi:MAG: cyclic nucleotide-binding domain-containing protein [Elusimicrobiales bacterium]|nr:cyclic nucleotide-binding domain-containing protein [Elusimicrobiales bacterium]